MTQEALRNPKALSVRTFTYKTVGSLNIKANVRRSEDDVLRPAVLWIHGGALIVGNREWLDGHLKNPLLRMGYVFVSIDYRLAPETKLPETVTDIVDAYDWIRREGPELFGVDSSRPISVAGSSAGGYLALSAGFRCSSRPASVTSFFGYGELIGGAWTYQVHMRGTTLLRCPTTKRGRSARGHQFLRTVSVTATGKPSICTVVRGGYSRTRLPVSTRAGTPKHMTPLGRLRMSMRATRRPS